MGASATVANLHQLDGRDPEECTDPRIGAQQRADECEPQPLWRGVDLDELGEVLCLCTDIGTSLRNARRLNLALDGGEFPPGKFSVCTHVHSASSLGSAE